ncbi:MAG: RluA family pseudouridine synthase [Pseudomonadota bacterium]
MNRKSQSDRSVGRPRVRLLEVSERSDGQRLDNFLMRECPGVPKTRLYRAIRKGEIRVDKGRSKAERRLKAGQIVRLPPLEVAERMPATAPQGWQRRLESAVLLEDELILAINKPPGLAVHGGSGLSYGLIETLRSMRSDWKRIELVHRLDRDTSGVLLLAKKPRALRDLHELFRSREGVRKSYLTLVHGKWPKSKGIVDAPLERFERKSGERMVVVSSQGKASLTSFTLERQFPNATLLRAIPVTGRTHQIRVHTAHSGHPILGDVKYASKQSEMLSADLKLKRLFLHSSELEFRLSGRAYHLQAALDDELEATLDIACKIMN